MKKQKITTTRKRARASKDPPALAENAINNRNLMLYAGPLQSQTNSMPSEILRIAEPHPNDVLCGRGGGINGHPGNKTYRDWITERKHKYNLAHNKDEKAAVSREIINLVKSLDPPGKFLQRDTSSMKKNGANKGNYWWVECDEKKAMAKTSQALREGAPSFRAEHPEEFPNVPPSGRIGAGRIGGGNKKESTSSESMKSTKRTDKTTTSTSHQQNSKVRKRKRPRTTTSKASKTISITSQDSDETSSIESFDENGEQRKEGSETTSSATAISNQEQPITEEHEVGRPIGIDPRAPTPPPQTIDPYLETPPLRPTQAVLSPVGIYGVMPPQLKNLTKSSDKVQQQSSSPSSQVTRAHSLALSEDDRDDLDSYIFVDPFEDETENEALVKKAKSNKEEQQRQLRHQNQPQQHRQKPQKPQRQNQPEQPQRQNQPGQSQPRNQPEQSQPQSQPEQPQSRNQPEQPQPQSQPEQLQPQSQLQQPQQPPSQQPQQPPPHQQQQQPQAQQLAFTRNNTVGPSIPLSGNNVTVPVMQHPQQLPTLSPVPMGSIQMPMQQIPMGWQGNFGFMGMNPHFNSNYFTSNAAANMSNRGLWNQQQTPPK